MKRPEEKAKELVESMIGGCCICPHDAKEAAITCVDEILSTAEDLYDECINSNIPDYTYLSDYWKDVKIEIEKL